MNGGTPKSLKSRLRRWLPRRLWNGLRRVRRRFDFRYATANPGPRDYLTAYDHADPVRARKSILWNDDWEGATRATVHILEEARLLRAGARALDFGGGMGRMTRALLEKHALEVVLVDASEDMRSHAERYLSGIPGAVVQAPSELGPPAPRFDLILLVEVAQHIPEVILDEEILPDLRARLAPGGTLFAFGNRSLDVDRDARTSVTSVESVLDRHFGVVTATTWSAAGPAGAEYRFHEERVALLCRDVDS